MKTLKATTLVIAALAASFLLSSCSNQKKWVEQMQTTFPDDTFTYDGHPFAATGKDKSKILVKSELYTGQIVVCEEDGELKSNYLAYVYKDFCTAELERVLTGRFPCDKYVIGQSDQYLNTQLVYPVKNMNAKEFIENYMDYDTALYLYVDGKENIPSEQEVEQYLMDLAADEPHAYDLLITYCDSNTLDGKAADVYTVQYMIDMSDEKTIKQFYVTYSDPSKDSYLYINN